MFLCACIAPKKAKQTSLRSAANIRSVLKEFFPKKFFKTIRYDGREFESRSFNYIKGKILFKGMNSGYYKLKILIQGTARPYIIQFSVIKYNSQGKRVSSDFHMAQSFLDSFWKHLSKSPESYDLLDTYRPF